MVLNIMLGDTSGAFAEVPESLAPLSKLSLIRHAFEGVLCSEFEGLVFEKEDSDAKSKTHQGSQTRPTISRGRRPSKRRGRPRRLRPGPSRARRASV